MVKYSCFAPKTDPENHGSSPERSLQISPLTSQSPDIWVGYRNATTKKYHNHPSFERIIQQSISNYTKKDKKSFPKWQKKGRGQPIPPDGRRFVRACCAACKDLEGPCEALKIEYIPVQLPKGSKDKVIHLIGYGFHLKGEEMIALLLYAGKGLYRFQKTDGSNTTSFTLVSDHACPDGRLPSARMMGDEESDEELALGTAFPLSRETDTQALYHSDTLPISQPVIVEHDIFQPVSELITQPVIAQPVSEPISDPISEPTTQPISEPIESHDPQKSPQPIQPSSPKRIVDLTEDEPDLKPIIKDEEQPDVSTPPTLPRCSQEPQTSSSSSSYYYKPDSLTEEYGRITTQIFSKYSMRLFDIPEVAALMHRMELAVKMNDRPALSRAYGALGAFLVSME